MSGFTVETRKKKIYKCNRVRSTRALYWWKVEMGCSYTAWVVDETYQGGIIGVSKCYVNGTKYCTLFWYLEIFSKFLGQIFSRLRLENILRFGRDYQQLGIEKFWKRSYRGNIWTAKPVLRNWAAKGNSCSSRTCWWIFVREKIIRKISDLQECKSSTMECKLVQTL